MKKRIFSVLLAVVMIATAINFMPVTQVYATMGHGTMSEGAGGKYEWDHNEGHWGQPRYYYNDGDYAQTDISGYSGGKNSVSEFTSATRHVTMFNDCTYQHTGIDSSGAQYTSDEWMPIAKSKANNKFTTLRGQNFVTEYYGASGANDPNGYYITLDQQWMPPYLVYGSGMASRENVDGSYVKFKPNNEKDIRMIFRNYNNSDYTYYTRNPNKPSYGAVNSGVTLRPGIDFGDYDYLEFDIKFQSGLNITKASLLMARVYLYYETNDASGKALEGNHQIEGYSDPVVDSAMNFKDQLFDANGNPLADNTWLTIRIDLRALEKGNTVKQVVVRIADPNMNTGCYIYMDDIRLVKNDDHPGVVYDHNNTGAADAMNYPSGKYYMINDFEYNGDTARYDLYSHGYDSTMYTGTQVAQTHAGQKFNVTTWNSFYPTIRQADANASDTICMKYQNGWSCNWGTQNENVKYKRNFIGGTNTVTQGDFALAVETPEYSKQADITALAGWLNPLCYERHYSSPLDLSSYTHFAIDVSIQTVGSNGIAQPQNTGDGVAPGVTFAIDLYDPSTVTDGYNYNNGASVLFFLPFGQYPWNYTGSRLYGDERYGTILPLGTEGVDYYAAENSTKTPYGNFRLVFTREQLMAGMASVGGADLSAIKGMRFVWLNRAPTSTNGYPMYSYPVTVTKKETNDTITKVYEGKSSVNNSSLRYRIILDNFIAYTPDTSITIVNQMDQVPAGEREIDLNQQFVYRIYGGYNATEAGCLGNSELGAINTKANFDGSDPITKEVDLTVAVPAGGRVTVKNLPFNSYFITQQNFSWRYTVYDKVCTLNTSNVVYKNSAANAMRDHNSASSHTASIKPIMWMDGTKTLKTTSNIWDVMHSRGGITVTFKQERTNPFSLNNNSVGASAFALWSEYDYCYRDWVDPYYDSQGAAYLRHSKTPLHWID